MPMTKKQLTETRQLAREVVNLITEVETALAQEKSYDPSARAFKLRYPEHIPAGAKPFSGTRLTGKLRRRSLDLSQALTELRRS